MHVLKSIKEYFDLYVPPIDSWLNINEGIHKLGLHTIKNNTFYSHKQNHYAFSINHSRLYLRICNTTNEVQILLIDNEKEDFALSIIRLKENIYTSLNEFLESKGQRIIENFFLIQKADDEIIQKIDDANPKLKDLHKLN